MHEFKERGVSIVFVSHNMDAVRKICNRTILLNKGAIVCDGSSDSVINEYYKINSSNMKAQKNAVKVIEIMDIRLVKENNEQAFDFRPGEKALFKIKLRAKKNIENVSFVVVSLRIPALLLVLFFLVVAKLIKLVTLRNHHGILQVPRILYYPNR